ncbi:MAG: hypothetical protein SFY32_14580 [Bacteroidota bacterium]|nr:hypothetical protein [Bacteroidota bacterium]
MLNENLEFRAFEIFKSHNFTQDEAEALIVYIREAKSEGLATDKRLSEVELKLTKEIREVELKIKDLEIKMEANSNNIIKWMVGLILGQTGLIFAILKLVDKI